MLRKPTKPPEGAKMKETADMLAWRKEFEKMKTEDHLDKLKELGLDDEDLDEFKDLKKGKIKLEDEFGVIEEDKSIKKKVKK
ncbi:MAG: hypothetical protein PHY04_02340 [Candidatus ainarchaeum sp.]|jgi:hypothetical protein|nr:hypothetical protein [Candidatus ainarchaeum sp.]MDD3085724.1 hypothetical protein [Candidatus ainarchaeum sp.]MDD4128552.1 hypothetical protein [Candidatus ainarchaeum sp.]MDD4467818.1 hypothetical protein [Candidatus ainarchaeum sp.]HPM85568.1 hypothetical protein [archaeon]